MKFVGILAAALLASAHGFGLAPLKTTKTMTTPLNIATNTDWGSDKPMAKFAASTPVAVNPISKAERAKIATKVIDPDFFMAASVFALGPLIAWYHPSYMADGSPSLIGVFGAGFHIVFAALLWVQTVRVRMVFEKDAIEFYNVKGPRCDLNKGGKLVQKPNNYVAGTVNRWKYDDIVHYGFFPSLEFPVICYIKETGTPKEQWGKWFAAFDINNSQGQPHFFPGICNARQIKREYERRGIKRKPKKGWLSLKREQEEEAQK